jgi:hydroxymethylpyrimidine/phosphomethylpyrimidine kinase
VRRDIGGLADGGGGGLSGAFLGRVLVVAGSDSGGGAGIQADIKAVMAMGGFATTAVTAVTAQDTLGVHGVFAVPPDFLKLQMRRVLGDIGADAFKTGMLADSATVEAVAEVFAAHPDTPFVLDPVMVAKGGHQLLEPGAVASLVSLLLPQASLVTPNVPEAEVLAGMRIATLKDQFCAADALLRLGVRAVLLKGGHMDSSDINDVLATPEGVSVLTSPRQETRHTHGTGCTLASAIAAGLARGLVLGEAVRRAHVYVQAAIASAPGFGAGHGPLDHAARWQDWEKERKSLLF